MGARVKHPEAGAGHVGHPLGVGPLPMREKVALAGRISLSLIVVRFMLRRYPLPEVVRRLGDVRPLRPPSLRPRHLGRIVHRVLRVGDHRARCLYTSLVLYKFLREQGHPAQFVIGLPRTATNAHAHAWIEIEGIDVGPPPGKGTHVELARYG